MKHRTATLASLLLLSACAAFVHAGLTSEAAAGGVAEPQRRAPRQQQRRRTPARRAPRVDYSDFSHRTVEHQGSCGSCHTSPTSNWPRVRRADEPAFPDVADYPEHESCLKCHKQQFFVGARPVICSVCHTNVSPRDGTRHPFRGPQEGPEAVAAKKPQTASEFYIAFPHDRHQDVMARLNPSGDEGRGFGFVRASLLAPQDVKKNVDSCSICHRSYQKPADKDDEFVKPPPPDLPKSAAGVAAFWMKKGTLKTMPTSHASCFNCHWQDGGENPLSSDCAGCHKLLKPGETSAALRPARGDADLNHPSAKVVADREVLAHWARRKSATFRHDDGNHLTYGCTSCHVFITTADKLDAETLRVPIQTCASTVCHGARTGMKSIIFKEVELRKKEGANFQCTKCHIGLGKDKTPDSHSNLFPPLKPK